MGEGREVVVIANANASGAGLGLAERAAAELGRLGAAVALHRTRTVGQMGVLWGGGRERLVVLVGGDGTLHSAVNLPGVPPARVALIPAGRANNVAHCLGIPLDPLLAARTALLGAPHSRPSPRIPDRPPGVMGPCSRPPRPNAPVAGRATPAASPHPAGGSPPMIRTAAGGMVRV